MKFDHASIFVKKIGVKNLKRPKDTNSIRA